MVFFLNITTQNIFKVTTGTKQRLPIAEQFNRALSRLVGNED